MWILVLNDTQSCGVKRQTYSLIPLDLVPIVLASLPTIQRGVRETSSRRWTRPLELRRHGQRRLAPPSRIATDLTVSQMAAQQPVRCKQPAARTTLEIERMADRRWNDAAAAKRHVCCGPCASVTCSRRGEKVAAAKGSTTVSRARSGEAAAALAACDASRRTLVTFL